MENGFDKTWQCYIDDQWRRHFDDTRQKKRRWVSEPSPLELTTVQPLLPTINVAKLWPAPPLGEKTKRKEDGAVLLADVYGFYCGTVSFAIERTDDKMVDRSRQCHFLIIDPHHPKHVGPFCSPNQ
jgi:hypothetical protein